MKNTDNTSGKTVFLFVFLFSFSLYSQVPLFSLFKQPADSIKVYRDSVLTSYSCYYPDNDKFIYYSEVKSTVPVKELKKSNTCYDNLYAEPVTITDIDTNEIRLIFGTADIPFNDQVAFIQDNNILGSFFAKPNNKNSKFNYMLEIGADINVNFGEIIAGTYYLPGGYVLYFNFECMRRTGKYYFRFFEPAESGFTEKPVKSISK